MISTYIKNPKSLFRALGAKEKLNWLPDSLYLAILYYITTGNRLHLNKPVLFTEKLQWLKIYNRNPFYQKLVDKYEVKQIVGEKIGFEHVIPTIGVWNSIEDIPFDVLPNKCVLKTTHDSGGIVFLNKEKGIDKSAVTRTINKHLNRNLYYETREWVYKDVPHRIICEPFLNQLNDSDLIDYKVLCFNGIPKLIEVHRGRYHGHHTEDFYDVNWNYTTMENLSCGRSGIEIERPGFLDEMLNLSRILSKDIPHVRVDWYYVNEVLLFGELTFFNGSGFSKFGGGYDKILGDWIALPDRNYYS